MPAEAVVQTTEVTHETPVAAIETKPIVESPKVEAAPTPKVEVPKTEAPKEIKYDLKLPEGSLLEASALDEILTIAKSKGLSNEAAQELLSEKSKSVSSFADKQKQFLKNESAKWVDSLSKDTEVGGAEFTRNIELAKRVVKQFANEEFIRALDDTGLGNHPDLVKTFVRIGKAMGEDRLQFPAVQVGQRKKTMAEVFYPKAEK